jgi:hypothetical protein
MSTLTIRMPDDTHARLRDLARTRGVSVNKLIEEMAVAALSAYDAEVRFRLMAARGRPERGLAILDRLDAADARKGFKEAKRKFRPQGRMTTKRK